MARIDELSIFSDRQVVDKITYSQRAISLTSEIDFGAAPINHFIKVLVEGTFSVGMTIDLMGAKSEDFSDAEVITSTRPLAASELVAGFRTYILVPPIGKKYKYICLKYRPEGSSDENDTEFDDNVCPTDPVLKPSTVEANTISAFYTTVADFDTTYEYANADKDTN